MRLIYLRSYAPVDVANSKQNDSILRTDLGMTVRRVGPVSNVTPPCLFHRQTSLVPHGWLLEHYAAVPRNTAIANFSDATGGQR
jgi:hypothetical protein